MVNSIRKLSPQDYITHLKRIYLGSVHHHYTISAYFHCCHVYDLCIKRNNLASSSEVERDVRNAKAQSGDSHTSWCLLFASVMADCADQHAHNRPHYVTAPLSVQRDRMDFFLWACSAGFELSWADKAWTHRSELYMLLWCVNAVWSGLFLHIQAVLQWNRSIHGAF